MNVNKVFLAGNLTANPETKEGKKAPFVTFSIAVNGLNQEVNFANCVAFGKTGELISKYFTKGKPIFVEGRYTSRKRKTKGYFYGITVESFQFVGSQKEADKDVKGNDEEDDSPF